MIYRIFHPVPALSDIVEYYWYSKIDLKASVIQHYATPLLQGLVFNFQKQPEQHTYNDRTITLDKTVYFFGQPVSPRIVNTHEQGVDILGVKFRPLGITKLTGINMGQLADEIVNAEGIWGNELESLCDQMQSASSLEKTIDVLETFLLKKYLQTTLHYRVDSAQNALKLITGSQGNIDVKTLQEQTNTSRKTLERAFMNYLGIHPKTYTRIVRFNAVKTILDQMPTDSNLTPIALDYGFYDSSHFISEFKAFAGVTPHTYLKTTSLNLVVKDF